MHKRRHDDPCKSSCFDVGEHAVSCVCFTKKNHKFGYTQSVSCHYWVFLRLGRAERGEYGQFDSLLMYYPNIAKSCLNFLQTPFPGHSPYLFRKSQKDMFIYTLPHHHQAKKGMTRMYYGKYNTWRQRKIFHAGVRCQSETNC